MAAGTGGAGGARSPKMNFRGGPGGLGSPPPTGTRPTPQPTSVREVMTVMVMHVCKKSIFFDTNIKVALYLAALFLVSLIADFIPFPKTYFSRSDNLFNQFFVKIGWFWTLFLTVPFVAMTSYTHCCGKRDRIIKGHLTRLAVATFMWYAWTSFFNYIEYTYGKCIPKTMASKKLCLQAGNFWNGFDISGHCFILIYSSLILIEEARAIIGWEGIRELIRDEDYARSVNDKTIRSNPLRNLTEIELNTMKQSYFKVTPYVRMTFIAMTGLQLLWDVMLFCTLLYYHIMVEKFISGVIAIFMWYITYRMWYKMPTFFPNSPGEGIFKYNKEKVTTVPLNAKRRSTAANGKHFMGMPIYNRQETTETTSDDPPPSSPR